jgi:hypothetical protein
MPYYGYGGQEIEDLEADNMNRPSHYVVDGAITSTPLLSEIKDITAEHPGMEVHRAHIVLSFSPEHAQIVYFPATDRAGISWNNRVEWTDAKSLEHAVELWIDGETSD